MIEPNALLARFGMIEVMKDEAILAFLADRGRTARYVTSVCGGSVILGMAGLLDGYRAATHWAAYDILEALGVEAGRERVVADCNRFSGGGVTAGIDFGLTLLAELRGEQVAKITQLMTTLILLVGIAVPLKHLAAQPIAVTIMGPVHGIAFCLYIWVVVQTIAGGGWSWREGIRLVLSALVPFEGYSTLFLIRRKAVTLRTADVAW